MFYKIYFIKNREEKENYYREHGIPLDKEAEYRE